MEKWIPIEEYLDKSILPKIDENIGEKYKKGILTNLKQFIYNNKKNAIREKGDKIYVDEIALLTSFVYDYFHKEECDYSAEDFAYSALRHFGMPPIEAMSVESLETTIRKLFENKYKDEVYIRRVQGRLNVACLSREYEMDIPLEPSVSSKIDLQKRKAERKRKDTDEWQEYSEEKAQIAYNEDLIANGISDEFEEPEDETTKVARALLSNDDFINKIADLVVKKIIENDKEES